MKLKLGKIRPNTSKNVFPVFHANNKLSLVCFDSFTFLPDGPSHRSLSGGMVGLVSPSVVDSVGSVGPLVAGSLVGS